MRRRSAPRSGQAIFNDFFRRHERHKTRTSPIEISQGQRQCVHADHAVLLEETLTMS